MAKCFEKKKIDHYVCKIGLLKIIISKKLKRYNLCENAVRAVKTLWARRVRTVCAP